MIKITNNIIPFKGFLAMTVWPFVFVRKEVSHKYNEVAERHENIHGAQQQEIHAVAVIATGVAGMVTMNPWVLLILPLYLYLYALEWLIRKLCGQRYAYHRLSFEQEAYDHEQENGYLERRNPFAWMKYLKK